MSTQEILEELPRLSAEAREQIAHALSKLKTDQPTVDPATMHEPRAAGLHAGAWIVADDFDDPLPDEFWFGKEA